MKRINDEFSNLDVSRQRKYQLRMAKKGRCIKCGSRALRGQRMCAKHDEWAYRYQRRRKGSIKSYRR